MRILVDTSILVRCSQPSSIHHQSAVDAVAKLAAKGNETCIVPQVIYEYWVVATRPIASNGLGFTVEEVLSDVAMLARMFYLLRDERRILEEWQRLVEDYRVTGKNAHDARLVAAMQRHGILNILTLNASDFQRYSGIQVLTPNDVLR